MPINRTPISEKGLEDSVSQKKRTMSFLLADPKYSFSDIILSTETIHAIQDILALKKHEKLIYDIWGLNKVYKKSKNITINLYGESGTGKTMAAHAIAYELEKKLVLVDYAEIESKYVGETSKNLVSLFNYAGQNNAVILFDEADALLSRRVTAMNSATDVSVNQTRNVLLKILDDYQGEVIFTTNFIENFDSAFFRRILEHIHFGIPDKEMRRKLWGYYLVPQLPYGEDRELIIDALCSVDSITGADISNAVLKVATHVAANNNKIYVSDLKTELSKILKAKESMNPGHYTITSRKVSEEYVQEKLGKEGIDSGN